MRYANSGSLTNYITKNFEDLKWKDKIVTLYNMILGLNFIHKEGLIHCDFHSGNVLYLRNLTQGVMIADLGLTKTVDQEQSSIIGVIPYIAPEVLNGRPYTQKSDIYSFGILMSELSTGQQPFYDKDHNYGLALKICEGLRPGFSNNTPNFYIELALKCMDADPDNRPTAEEILKIITFWKDANKEAIESNKPNYSKKQLEELEIMSKVFDKMDNIKYHHSTITETKHPNAVYTSRLLKYKGLSQPKNSNKVTIISNDSNGNYGNYLILLSYINF
jgi:serine/threonine protein kinase